MLPQTVHLTPKTPKKQRVLEICSTHTARVSFGPSSEGSSAHRAAVRACQGNACPGPSWQGWPRCSSRSAAIAPAGLEDRAWSRRRQGRGQDCSQGGHRGSIAAAGAVRHRETGHGHTHRGQRDTGHTHGGQPDTVTHTRRAGRGAQPDTGHTHGGEPDTGVTRDRRTLSHWRESDTGHTREARDDRDLPGHARHQLRGLPLPVLPSRAGAPGVPPCPPTSLRWQRPHPQLNPAALPGGAAGGALPAPGTAPVTAVSPAPPPAHGAVPGTLTGVTTHTHGCHRTLTAVTASPPRSARCPQGAASGPAPGKRKLTAREPAHYANIP